MTVKIHPTACRIPPINFTRDNEKFLAYALALVPLLIIAAPRAAAFMPPVIALIGLAVFIITHKRLPVFSKNIYGPVIAILAVMSASCLWAVDVFVALEQTLKTVPILLGGAVLLTLASQMSGDNMARFAKNFPLAVMSGGALCVIDLYSGGLLYHLLHGSHAPFNLTKPNRSVIVFFLCALATLPLLLRERELGKMRLASLLFGIILMTLAKTDSQSAQLAVIVGAVFYFFFPYRQTYAWRILALSIAALLLAAPFLAQWMFQTLPAYTTGLSWFNNAYAGNRMEIWDFVSRKALERPLTGFGVEAARVLNFDSAMQYHRKTTILHPHNFALQLWIEFGIIGVLLGGGFFAFLLRQIKMSGGQRLALPTLCAALSVGVTAYGLWQGWWLGLLCFLAVYSFLAIRQAEFLRSVN